MAGESSPPSSPVGGSCSTIRSSSSSSHNWSTSSVHFTTHGTRASLSDLATRTVRSIAIYGLYRAASLVAWLPFIGSKVAGLMATPRPSTPPDDALAAGHADRCALNRALQARHTDFLSAEELRVHVCTWNVASTAPPKDLSAWLTVVEGESGGALPDVLAVGLQETETGGAALMLEVTDARVTWLECILDALNQHPEVVHSRHRFRRVEAVQLVGMVLLLIARNDHLAHIRNVRKAITRTGALSATMGNKGAIGVRATIYGKRFLFIAAHFTPHDRNAPKREANYRTCLAELRLDVGDVLDDEADHCASFLETANGEDPRGGRLPFVEEADGGSRVEGGFRLRDRLLRRPRRAQNAVHSGQRLIRNHDYVFFFGDLNYRLIDIEPSSVVQRVLNGDYDTLLEHDELRRAMIDGTVFRNFLEAEIGFAPTYRYKMGTSLFDLKRKPAYTDRVLFRYLAADEDVVAPFAPVSSGVSKLFSRVARPLLSKLPAGPDSLRVLASRARKASSVVRNGEPVLRRRRGFDSSNALSLGSHDDLVTTSGVGKPVAPPETPLVPLQQATNNGPLTPPDTPARTPPSNTGPFEEIVLPPSAASRSASYSSDDIDTGSDGSSHHPPGERVLRGMPYILNHLAVERYTSYPTYSTSDHKPVAAAFRVTVVRTDRTRAQQIVRASLQAMSGGVPMPSLASATPPRFVAEDDC